MFRYHLLDPSQQISDCFSRFFSARQALTKIAFRFSFDDFHNPIRPINIFIFRSLQFGTSIWILDRLLACLPSRVFTERKKNARFADVKFFADTSQWFAGSSCRQRFVLLASIMPSKFLLPYLFPRMSARHLVE